MTNMEFRVSGGDGNGNFVDPIDPNPLGHDLG
jgi:hypothetical protein